MLKSFQLSCLNKRLASVSYLEKVRTREQHGSEASVACQTKFFRNYPRQYYNNRIEIEWERYIQWIVGVGIKSLILLIAPIPEAIFLDNLSMCVCHRRFSSINIPSDFTEVTFSIGTLSIESSGWLDKVLNFCLDPISINSVLAVFKVSLLEISHLFRLPKS